MNSTPQQSTSGFNPQEILYILYRHKWMIALFALVGLGASAMYYFSTPPVYESQAKLLVRYVLERSAIDSIESESSPGGRYNNVISAEIEILNSWDLAVDVAEAVGIERLAPEGAGSSAKLAAAGRVSSGISVSAPRYGNVITVAYRDRNPELASIVLSELSQRYFNKHLEVHRSLDAFDFVSQQTDQVRAQLRQTEEELKKLKAQAGVLSLSESTTRINVALARSQNQLLEAEATLAQQKAFVGEIENTLPLSNGMETDSVRSGAASVVSDGAVVQRYQALIGRLSKLRSEELELLGKYSSGNPLLQSTRGQIEELDQQRQVLERKFPGLRGAVEETGESSSQHDIISERARLTALEVKVETLKKQVRAIQNNANRLSEVGPKIQQLERKKEVQETNYKYFESSLEKARIDEALDPSKIPNITVVQNPSPPLRVVGEKRNLVLGLAGGGLGLGLGLALLIELFLDRRVKRPLELETRVNVPLFLSVPYLSRSARLGLNKEKRLQSGTVPEEVATGHPSHFMRPFAESIRDRLILSFQLKNLTHKPKLVGITGVAGGEGASTLATNLAASLSETGEGKVLLVDLNPSHSNANDFSRRAAIGLTDALKANGNMPPASENLYIASGSSDSEKSGSKRLQPKQFYAMIPSLKASDFDYIIFDLPPVSRSSATLAMSGSLDKLLLVVEAEKSDRDQVKRAYDELAGARADVAAILNKTRKTPFG